MKRKWKERYSEKFRRRAVARMNACDNIIRLSKELCRNRSLLYKWRYRLEPPDSQVEGTASTENRRESTLRGEITKLKRLLADKTVEVDFFRGALQKVGARRQQSGISGEKASAKKFEMSLQGSLSIERMCQMAQISRAGFYRYLQGRAPKEEDMTLRSAIQEIALKPRAQLRISTHHSRTAPTRNHGEPQTCGAIDAGRQLVDDPES